MPIRAIKLCGSKFVHSEFCGNVICDMKVEMFDHGKINITIKHEKFLSNKNNKILQT